MDTSQRNGAQADGIGNPSTVDKPIQRGWRAGQLFQSGLIYAAISFLGSLGNYVFLMIQGRYLLNSEFGYVTAATTFINMLGLPVSIATYAVTHYIARFQASGQEAHLRGLVVGCRRILFRLTMVGSILVIVAVKPLGDYFNIPRSSLMLIAACCALAGLWGGFITALCQGLAWFKRLALIGLLATALRIGFGWAALINYPWAESAVVAVSGIGLLANFVLFFWRKDLRFSRHEAAVSPWDRQFIEYLIVGAAYVGGGFCLQQGDMLVATRHFPDQLGAYSYAWRLAQSLPMLVGPLLTVLFAHRSGEHKGGAVAEQFRYLGMFAAGLLGGAIGLVVLKKVGIWLLAHNEPNAAAVMPVATSMVNPMAITMIFFCLLQALGTWALASRWLRVSLLYGLLGLAYWLTLLWLGRTPADLLRVMPLASGTAFAILLVVWLTALRSSENATR